MVEKGEAYGGVGRTESEGPFSAPALGQYMSRNQSGTLLHNLRLCQYTEDLKEDLWVPIRGAVKFFNKNREEGLWSGLVLCADENMGAW